MRTPNLYERLVRPALFSLDPEQAHHLAIGALRQASAMPPLLAHLRRRFAPPDAPRTVFGLTFPNPVGLAAGFDKNGVALPAWEALGFGFIEVGTVTAKAQLGNAKPRIFRYPETQALINRLGFNNDGAETIAQRFRALKEAGKWPRIPVGINIGKSRITPLEEAPADYAYSFRLLREFADYVVLNVSSPNTPGLRGLQEHDALRRLVDAIHAESATTLPLLVKIAPDLDRDALESLVQACEASGVAGFVATNTTLDHSSIAPDRDEAGGLSGEPLRERSTQFVRAISGLTSLPVIGVGGVSDAASAREKFDAGASLIQIYTGYVYRGPGLLREIVAPL